MVAITGVCGGGGGGEEEDTQSPSTRDPDVEEIIFMCAVSAAASRRGSALTPPGRELVAAEAVRSSSCRAVAVVSRVTAPGARHKSNGRSRTPSKRGQ